MKNYSPDEQNSEAVREVVEKLRSTFFKAFIRQLYTIPGFKIPYEKVGNAFGVTRQYIQFILKEGK